MRRFEKIKDTQCTPRLYIPLLVDLREQRTDISARIRSYDPLLLALLSYGDDRSLSSVMNDIVEQVPYLPFHQVYIFPLSPVESLPQHGICQSILHPGKSGAISQPRNAT